MYKTSTTQQVSPGSIGMDFNLKNGNLDDALQYLKGAGFIEAHGNKSKMTYEGVRVIEHAILNPSVETEHFPPFEEIGINE